MTVLLLHCAMTLFLTGVIWFVQVVHYPLFSRVGRDSFAAYEGLNTQLTTWVVAPAMLLELGTAIWLVTSPPPRIDRGILWAGLGLLGVIWVSTFLLQVPAHRALSEGFDPAAHRRLVTTNWIRTIAWTVRAGGALYLVVRGIGRE